MDPEYRKIRYRKLNGFYMIKLNATIVITNMKCTNKAYLFSPEMIQAIFTHKVAFKVLEDITTI